MKKRRWFGVLALWSCIPFAQDAGAQDYARWNLPEGALSRLGKGSFGYGDPVVAFSPDGGRLAIATGIGIWMFDLRSAVEVARFTRLSERVNSVSFSPDGKTLASGSRDGTVLLWNVSPEVKPQPSATPDFDGDGAVDFTDFLKFAQHFGTREGGVGYDARYDLDADGTVGFSDFLLFAGRFGEGG